MITMLQTLRKHCRVTNKYLYVHSVKDGYLFKCYDDETWVKDTAINEMGAVKAVEFVWKGMNSDNE